MNLRRAVVLALTALLAVVALQAPASAATTRALSAAAAPSSALAGKSVAVAGTLTKSPKGSTVTVQRKVGKKWVAVKSARTTATGRWSTRVTLGKKVGTSTYRAVAAKKGSLRAATSKSFPISALATVRATVKAAPSTVTAGANAIVSGTVKPFTAGAPVGIQIFTNKAWRSTGLSTRLTSKGTFARAVQVRTSAIYRVYVPRVGLKASTVSGSTFVLANPVISTASLPDGSVNAAYVAQLTQVGSDPGTWSVTPALPSGLTLNAGTGRITGTPTAALAAKNFTFRFAQPGLVTASRTLSLTITNPVPPVISTSTLPDGQVDDAYTATLTATGSPTGTWKLFSGSLPDGVTLTAATGLLSGVPTDAGTFDFAVTFTQTNTGLVAAAKSLSIVIAPKPAPPAPVIATTSLPTGKTFQAYSAFVTAVGNPAGTWTLEFVGAGLANFKIDPATGEITGPGQLVPVTRRVRIGFTATGNPTRPATPVELDLKITASGS